MSDQEPPKRSGLDAREEARMDQPLTLSSKELFQGRNTVLIEHAGQQYCLRITRQNKLILTK